MRQDDVLDVMRAIGRPCTSREIRDHAPEEWSSSRCCARLRALAKWRCVRIIGQVEEEGRTVRLWEVSE